MKLEYFRQDDDTYLAVEPETDHDGCRLVIEVERIQKGKFRSWEAHSSRRPVFSFIELPRIRHADMPNGVARAARIKYSQH